jgi:hypothetical protein
MAEPPFPVAPLKADDINAEIARLRPVFIRKTANESVISSTTYQNDNELVASGVASAIYVGRLQLLVNSDAAADIKARLTLPSGAVATSWGLYKNAVATVVADMAVGAGVATSGSDEPLLYMGLLVMSTTAGDVQVQWAQNASTAINTTVSAGSFLMLERVA